MALAFSHLKFLLEVRKAGLINIPVDIIEFGQQNWFGDVNINEIVNCAKILNIGEERIKKTEKSLEEFRKTWEGADQAAKNDMFFGLAELFYEVIFDVKKIDCVDLHGQPKAKKYDLNDPLPIKEKYDVVTNFGTGEHVFNQYMFFKNIHDMAKTGGFIFHSMPNQGCYDHGFFNYHPTFIFDLAKFNNYDVLAMAYCDLKTKPATMVHITRARYVELAVNGNLSPYSCLLVLLQKTKDEPFAIPQQSYYDDALPPELKQAWEKLEK